MIRKAGAIFALAFLILTVSACSLPREWAFWNARAEKEEEVSETEISSEESEETGVFTTVFGIEIPPFSGTPLVSLNGNSPFFSDEEKEKWSGQVFDSSADTDLFLRYSELDEEGRCGPAMALISLNTLPKEERGVIGDIRPSGWQTVKYEGIDGNFLYNRCHLIAYCLAGDNADVRNLITGTRYLNIEGMLPIELEVLDHVIKKRDHVLYRATPVFQEDETVARGVLIEALSMEDDGQSLSLCVFCYNIQPGIEIDYATGESEQVEVIYMPSASESKISSTPESQPQY